MIIDIWTDYGILQVVNRVHREYPEHADLALSIVGQWKKTAQDHQERRERYGSYRFIGKYRLISRSPSPVERRIKKEVKEEEDDYPGERYGNASYRNHPKKGDLTHGTEKY